MPRFPSALPNKLPNTGTTIFTKMSALAAETGAINLSQGFPDFDPDKALVNAVAKAMRSGHNQYAPMPGLPALREAIAGKIAQTYGASFSPEAEITVTAGGTQALFTAIQSVVREGDEVLLFEPAYDCYVPAIRLAGGDPIHVPLDAANGYAVHWDAVKSLISSRTRMIILNNPHNPTGAIWTAEDRAQLEKLTEGTDIILLADEVYEHLVFNGKEHQSVLGSPKLAERSFAVYSFGKTYHCTGWKVGYCVAPENLMKAFRMVHQYEVFAVNHPVQVALAQHLAQREAYEGLAAFYQEKRDRFRRLLEGSRFDLLPCSGTYFQLLGYRRITDEADDAFAVRMTGDYGVAAIPISVFYRDKTDRKVLRFCFAKSDETLERAAEKLHAV
jgi:methionine aminotransferase